MATGIQITAAIIFSTICTDVQAAHTASELALQLRKLDSHIQWESLKRPLADADSPYATADILDRRPAVAGMGWDYLVQMAPVEGLTPGLGSAGGVRQPLQPLVPQLLPAQQLQAKSHQKLLQQPQPSAQSVLSGAPQPAFKLPQQAQQQEAGQQLPQQALHVPAQPMIILPNNAAVQQQQQAAGPEEDKQIAVQQRISNLSDSDLAQQAPLIAEAARVASSTLPDHPQLVAESAAHAESPLPNGTQTTAAVNGQSLLQVNGSLTAVQAAISDQGRDVPAVEMTTTLPSPSSAEQLSQAVAASVSESPAAGQHVTADTQSGLTGASMPEKHASEATTVGASAELSQQLPHPTQTPHPPAVSTPFAAQAAPKQASSLSSLIPHAQHRPSSASTSALGQNGRISGAGPSREGTPNPRGPANWVHESTLPLWFVKIFEEKRRRDVAMVAARAAQQAQREAARGASLLSARWNAERKLLSSSSPHSVLS